MEASGLNGASNFDDEKALKGLLEAFGAAFSLDQIASAYCKAGKNAGDAAEALAMSTPNGEAKPRGEEESSRLSLDNSSKKPYLYQANGNSKASKPKYRPVSGGSVSSIIGKHYGKKTASANGSCNATKPLKLDSEVLPMSETWVEKAESNPSRNDGLHQDMEDFLFTMLGDGFKLERERIREVLDSCGYDMEKSIEKLINLPASTSDKRNGLVTRSSDKSAGLYQKSEVSSERKCINTSEGNGDKASNTNGVDFTGQKKEGSDLQKEVLAALFSASERSEERPEELPRRIIKAANRYGAYGQLVVEPPNDFISECKSVVYQQHPKEDDADDEDDYQVLRKAVKEYRTTMKEYFQAAVEAFSKKDHDRANKLLEQGKFFQEKAREADEESNEMILRTRNVETQGEIVLDLHERSAKEAIRLLKCQISSFSGISSIKCLKVIIDTQEEEISKGSRRRVLVLKLLQEESIKWTEGEKAGTILIQLDSINRKRLTFIKK
ncbi:PREDICTED: putative nuclear RNA export [Prunus dulcis]|uniref:PREDICTED: putative nuclear RNA export n=1 Tax=Prunus dulcis TaxID=3755 RepID=A0A5E4FAM2_PRUDU|nr:putative nuclear RNA export factor SDE5 isoform X1 [Prunus dulcis]VVA23621.1 PREDICTED: putative nuclear RNA export [Prunus dulcis]